MARGLQVGSKLEGVAGEVVLAVQLFSKGDKVCAVCVCVYE